MFQPKSIDFTKTTTFSASQRHNLVRIDNLRTPGAQPDDLFDSPEFTTLIEKLKEAKAAGKTITCFIGAHVIKCGLSRYLIWLMQNGYITHLASNGAGSIHDFELAYLGGTSEHAAGPAQSELGPGPARSRHESGAVPHLQHRQQQLRQPDPVYRGH